MNDSDERSACHQYLISACRKSDIGDKRYVSVTNIEKAEAFEMSERSVIESIIKTYCLFVLKSNLYKHTTKCSYITEHE